MKYMPDDLNTNCFKKCEVRNNVLFLDDRPVEESLLP